MTCMSPAVTVESYDNLAPATTTGADQHKPAYKRRHSSFVPRQLSQSLALDGEEGLLLKVGY
jgi:adiponectin receptor